MDSSYKDRATALLKLLDEASAADELELVIEALRAEFSAGLGVGRRAVIDESAIAATLTSACARLIGLAKRDDDMKALAGGQLAVGRAIDGLEEFGRTAGCDTGAEGVLEVLRELLGYIKSSDYAAASAALDRRLKDRAAGQDRAQLVEAAARELCAADEACAEAEADSGAEVEAQERYEKGWDRLRAALGTP